MGPTTEEKRSKGEGESEGGSRLNAFARKVLNGLLGFFSAFTHTFSLLYTVLWIALIVHVPSCHRHLALTL